MHRVELVVYLDRSLAKKFDAYSVIERIENGGFPDVSMGCKVPFDVCSICGNKSKTRDDYCDHCKYMMNKILPDGRKVYVLNLTPRFFDISFVFIGADKTAKVMAKLAQVGEMQCLGDFCSIPRHSVEVGEIFSPEVAYQDQAFQKVASSNFYMLGQEKTAKAVKKQTTFDGLTLKLEYVPGDIREGEDKEGKAWKKTMHASYGYVPRTAGEDGEAVDIYLADEPKSGSPIFVIEQSKEDGSYDEDKVMLGYPSKEAAVNSFLRHMPGVGTR